MAKIPTAGRLTIKVGDRVLFDHEVDKYKVVYHAPTHSVTLTASIEQAN